MKIKSGTSTYLLITLLILFLTPALFAQESVENLIFDNPSVAASYIGGQDSLDKFLEQNINYANLTGVEGEVTIGFVVEKDGRSHSMLMTDKSGFDYAVEAARVLSLIDNWLPGKNKKKVVRSMHYVKVKFKRPADYVFAEIIPIDASSVYDGIGDLQPEFPGGTAAFLKFLSENIVYPDLAMEYNIQGKVYVKYVVQKDGTITKIQILKGIGHGCDLEALRVMAECPLWMPGFQEGKAVNVWYTMPINFQMQ